jgi:hypothetical protein
VAPVSEVNLEPRIYVRFDHSWLWRQKDDGWIPMTTWNKITFLFNGTVLMFLIGMKVSGLLDWSWAKTLSPIWAAPLIIIVTPIALGIVAIVLWVVLLIVIGLVRHIRWSFRKVEGHG